MYRIHRFICCGRGQTTAEYALVLLIAGLVVGVFAAFVRSGALSEFFSAIVESLVERAER